MVEVVQAFSMTIQRLVVMLFQLPLADGLSVGAFMISVAILGAVIGLVFSLITVPGGKWCGAFKSLRKDE